MAENFQVWLENLKENSDIVSTISRYVPLKKKGKTWWGTCPFHFEKTPSFAVNEMEQYYHCFGCGASGNVINFVQKYESLEFMEAVEVLAKNANMQMPIFNKNANIAKLKKQKDIAYNVLKDAAIYYYKNLVDPSVNKLAQSYIDKRKLDKATVKTFGLGYSIGWNQVISHLKTKGYSTENMELAGIVDQKDGKHYDAYAKRLIFPIINANGDVIGFSARLLEDQDFAKYKNTSQTCVFDKSRAVYSINNIKKLKQSHQLNEIILVEGQMDVISLYKSGVKNAVATMGTSLSAYHAKELKRYCEKVVVCFDGDGAGVKATLRSLDILRNVGLEVYVASLPAGVDPDEYIYKYGKEQYLQLIEKAEHWVEFLMHHYERQYDLSKPNEKSDFVITALEVIEKLESNSEKSVYLALLSKISNINISVLQSDFKDKSMTDKESVTKDEEVSNSNRLSKENAYAKAVKFIMASLIHKKPYAYYDDDIKNSLLNNDYIKIYDYLNNKSKDNKLPSISSLFDMFDVEANEEVKDVINYEFYDGVDNKEYFESSVKLILKTGLQMKMQQLTEEYRKESDNDKRREISKKIREIIAKQNDK